MSPAKGASAPKKQSGYYPGAPAVDPDVQGIRMFVNRGAGLTSGHLLLSDQSEGAVYRMDPASGEVEFILRLYDMPGFLFRTICSPDGVLFCSVTGTRYQEDRNGVTFGAGGAVLRIDHRRELISVVPGSDKLTDPCDLQLLEDGDLLVSDFKGFFGTGEVLRFDPRSGTGEVVVAAPELVSPIGAWMDEAAGKVYVANARMRYEYPEDPGHDTGEIYVFDVERGEHSVLVPTPDPPQGMVLGINGEPGSDHLVMVFSDAPLYEFGGVHRIDKATGETTPLIAGGAERKGFYSPHAEIRDGVCWVADSYQKELVGVEVASAKVVERHSMAPILGEVKGVEHQFDLVDCVAVLP